MRLIDADKLKRKVQMAAVESYVKKLKASAEVVLNQCIDWIEQAPTVEQQHETGEWEIYVISMLDGEGCRCSKCGTEGAPHWNYCPNCGLEMRTVKRKTEE